MSRSPLAALVLTLALLVEPMALSTPAGAVSVSIHVGNSLSSGRPISCAEGARRVRSRGFRDVRRINCSGRYFVYRAWRRGRQYEIAVRRSNGRVVDVRRVGRRRF